MAVNIENIVYIENTKKNEVLEFEIGELLEKIQYRRTVESQQQTIAKINFSPKGHSK